MKHGTSRIIGLVGILAVSCSDDGTSTAADASADVQGSDDADGGESGDVARSRDGAVTETALDRYCAAAATYASECRDELGVCSLATLEQCPGVYVLLRDEYVAAREVCGFPGACGPTHESFEQRHCNWDQTRMVEPTALQTELAEAICFACGPTGERPCLQNFFFRAEPREGSVGASGTGASYFRFSDSFVERLLDRCVPPPGTDSCRQTFYDCLRAEQDVLEPASVTSACSAPAPGD
jgi:hypothetical protein